MHTLLAHIFLLLVLAFLYGIGYGIVLFTRRFWLLNKIFLWIFLVLGALLALSVSPL